MTRYTSVLTLWCVIAFAGAPLSAQQDDDARVTRHRHVADRDDEQATIDTTIPFAASGGVVDLSIVSGEITVTGWNRSEARVHVTSDDDETPVHFEHASDRIMLDARRGGRYHGDDNDVHYDLTVPVGTRVLMHSTSGDLHARGTHGEVEARSVSGDMTVDDVTNGATLESVSGSVQARMITGDVHARSVSGDVDLYDVSGDITLSSVSGHGDVTAARSRVVRMETVSGDLSYAGTLDPAGIYDFRAHSGNITLELPADAGALLSVDTFSGDVQTDFPLTIQPAGDRGPPRHHIDTTLGRGGAHITISTFSGDIELRRAGHSHPE